MLGAMVLTLLGGLWLLTLHVSASLFRGYAPPTEKCQSRLKWTKPSARFAPPPKILPDPCLILDIFAAL